jgi:hypothetical protein
LKLESVGREGLAKANGANGHDDVRRRSLAYRHSVSPAEPSETPESHTAQKDGESQQS